MADSDTITPGRAVRHAAVRRILEPVTGPWTWRNLFAWFVVVSAVFVVKGCLVDQYTIPSGSMEPTLNGDPRLFRGDRVLVNKSLFGPRIPFTSQRLWTWAAPKRWDIVVFHAVEENAAHPVLIKRVAALPGEHVRIFDGKLWINGEAVSPPGPLAETLRYTTELTFDAIDRKRQFLRFAQANEPLAVLNPHHEPVRKLYADMERVHPLTRNLDIDALTDEKVESLCRGVEHASLNLIRNMFVYLQPEMRYGIFDDDMYSVVPENHYFLLGDNSAQSLDGRVYGWVPHNHLLGRAFAVWWPWSHRKDFTGFSRTWWGMTLLIGIPGSFLGFEIHGFLRKRRRSS